MKSHLNCVCRVCVVRGKSRSEIVCAIVVPLEDLAGFFETKARRRKLEKTKGLEWEKKGLKIRNRTNTSVLMANMLLSRGRVGRIARIFTTRRLRLVFPSTEIA